MSPERHSSSQSPGAEPCPIDDVSDPTNEAERTDGAYRDHQHDYDELMHRICENWELDERGELRETSWSEFDRRATARRIIDREIEGDQNVEEIIREEVERLLHETAAELADKEGRVKELKAIYDSQADTPNPALTQAIEQLKSSIAAGSDRGLLRQHPDVVRAVSRTLAEQERAALETYLQQRIEADHLPWTMPNPQVSPAIIDYARAMMESIAAEIPPQPDDEFKVARPLRMMETQSGYAEADEALLTKMGRDVSQAQDHYFTREELQRAGVFFVNRIGGGEQPIFGVRIPDPENPAGYFDPHDRCFLTREEFERIYKYQQEMGYGVGDEDAADVQRDMIMFTIRPEGRNDLRKLGGGAGSRENKYGLARSPFVDSGFRVTTGVEASVQDPEGGVLRMNTTTIHLINAHPDYPGVSEMYTDTAAHDQRYMSGGEFIRHLYQRLPDTRDAFLAVRYGLPTPREIAWVGRARTAS